MNYSKHTAYKILTKKEKQFLNTWIERMKEEFRSQELEQEFFANLDTTAFKHKDQVIQLFLLSDESGSVPDKLDENVSKVAQLENDARKTRDTTVKKTLMGINKDVYGRGAYKRWKKAGCISSDGKYATINQQKYEIIREGKKFRLVVPGQKQLPLTKGEQSNGKESKSKRSK